MRRAGVLPLALGLLHDPAIRFGLGDHRVPVAAGVVYFLADTAGLVAGDREGVVEIGAVDHQRLLSDGFAVVFVAGDLPPRRGRHSGFAIASSIAALRWFFTNIRLCLSASGTFFQIPVSRLTISCQTAASRSSVSASLSRSIATTVISRGPSTNPTSCAVCMALEVLESSTT